MAKKIIAIVSLVLIGLLISATLVMANVKVNYGINCSKPNIIRVLKPSSADADSVSETQKAEIEKFINGASKESSLTALFNGTLFEHAQVETDVSTPTAITTKSNCYYVQYVYTQPQILKEGNKNYKENNQTYLYKELWFEVSNLEGVNSYNVYIVPYLDNNGEENQNSKISAKHYVLNANLLSLYNYLVENFK